MNGREDWYDVRARALSSETLAYHEAGHAVVAYEFGWWVRRGGVRVCPSPVHGMIGWASLSGIYNTGTDICVSMAGLLAEEKFHGRQWGWEVAVINHWRAYGHEEDTFPALLGLFSLAPIETLDLTTHTSR